MAKIKALAEVVEGLKAKVYTFDNLSPVSRVSVYVKAGSRYEPNAVPGIAHFLKASAGLTTEASSKLGFVKHLESASARFNVSLEREYLVYRVDCLRDKLGFALQFVDHQLHRPEFRSWELSDVVQPKLKEELKLAKSNQDLLITEAMHKAAYRGGLAHATLVPEHQIERIKNHHLFEYVVKNVVPSRITIVGLGVANKDLSRIIENSFKFNNSDYRGVGGEARYVGGEARIQAGFSETQVNYVAQGAPISDFKFVAALEILTNMFGGYEQTFVKYGLGTDASISKLLASSNLSAVKPSFVNISHSDTGLFGVSLKGPPEQVGKALVVVKKYMRKVMSNISADEFKRAKALTLNRLLVTSENHELSYSAMSKRCVHGLDKIDPLEVLANLSQKDMENATSKLFKSSPTLVTIGNPRYVPYLDELGS